MRTVASAYMQWSKSAASARINLALSDLSHVSLAELGVTAQELELNGPNAYGYRPLVEAIAALNGVAREAVVTSLGASMANHLAMAAMLAPGDEVLMETPTYELLESTARYLGATVRSFPRRGPGFAVDPDEVRRLLSGSTRLVVLTNLHNPSSAATGDDVLREIGAAAAERGARVLVDEVYRDALFDAAARPAVHLGSQFVVTSSLTKVYGLSGLRCGWILAEPELAARIWHLSDLFYSTPPHLPERAAVVAMRELPRLRERARALLAANIRLFNGFLEAEGARIDCPRHAAGLVAFPGLPGTDVEKFCSRLRQEYDTTVAPGRFFGAPGHIRIGLGHETATLAKGLENISAALDDLGRRG